MSSHHSTYQNAKCCSTDGHHHEEHHEGHHDDHGHSHDIDEVNIKLFLPAILSFLILISGVLFDYWLKPTWFDDWIRVVWYGIAFIPVGFPVMKEAWESIRHGDVFSEFFLMSIATIGAFAIGEYPEAVSVMLFYAIGEIFQSIAVTRAQANIQSLIDQRPEEVTILENGMGKRIKAEEAQIGQIIQLKPGEKLGLDGELLSDYASFNTSALTGESVPNDLHKGAEVLAGMINLNQVVEIKITREYSNSQLSKILHLVRNASSQKAPTELFISKFAKVYTPIVVFLAIAICLIPYFFVEHYEFKDWLYRALIFLVISCPCALVISIPLGYFGGIGAASRNGILVKGGNFLDSMAVVKHIVMDKTGTLTKGVFKVRDVVFEDGVDPEEMLNYLNTIEGYSTHPIATAVRDYVGEINPDYPVEQVEEIAGQGVKAIVKGKPFWVGNLKLFKNAGIPYDKSLELIPYTTLILAYDSRYIGHVTIADEIKEEAAETIKAIKKLGVKPMMLSGDKTTVVQTVAQELEIENAFGDLLPQDKVNHVLAVKKSKETVAFVGDGLNDAPVIAISDVGIAMGGLGSDVAIETADIVIQDDAISKIPMAIHIGQKTKRIVWQNIFFAFAVKLLVLGLGAGGIATLWEAVFADVGVALIAIFNATRILKTRFT